MYNIHSGPTPSYMNMSSMVTPCSASNSRGLRWSTREDSMLRTNLKFFLSLGTKRGRNSLIGLQYFVDGSMHICWSIQIKIEFPSILIVVEQSRALRSLTSSSARLVVLKRDINAQLYRNIVLISRSFAWLTCGS